MSKIIDLFTIGFTQKSAEQFFELLIKSRVKLLIDTRLTNSSQLAGFTKQRDLEYFLLKICNIKYVHILDFAPTKDILNDYKKKKISWDIYKEKFNHLISDRAIENKINSDLLDNSCLLCSEANPHNCHRRLVAEYLEKNLNESVNIHHL